MINLKLNNFLFCLIILIESFFLFSFKYGGSNLTNKVYIKFENEYSYCDDDYDGFVNIDIEILKNNLLVEYLNLYSNESALYISTSLNRVHKVTNILSQPQIDLKCVGTFSFGYADIALSKNDELFICSGSYIRKINTNNCNILSDINLDQFFNSAQINSLSFDFLDNLYFSSPVFNSKVYKFTNYNFTNLILWCDFGEGRPGGDFVMNNGKMYVSWVVNNIDYLYEVEVNNLNEYVSHRILGTLPNGTFGLASELGILYGVTENTLFKINLFDNYITINNILSNNIVNDKWFGLTGENEAISFITNAYLNLTDAQNNINPLSNNWQNTISGGQTIYISILNTLTKERQIIPINIKINKPPVYNKIEKKINCANYFNSNVFDLNSLSDEIKIGLHDEVYFFTSLSELINNQNSISGNYETSTNNTTIFVKIIDSITGCYSYYNLQLIIQKPLFNKIEKKINCLNYLNPNVFDLNSLTNEIKIGLHDEVYFFTSLSELINNQNSISGNYETSTNNTTIFVKIIDSITGCYSYYNLQLIIQKPPLCSDVINSKLCVDDLNYFSINLTTNDLITKYNIQEQGYEIKIFNSLNNANNDLNSVDSILSLNESNFNQYTNLFFRVKDLITNCISICEKNLIFEEYSFIESTYNLNINDFSNDNFIVILADNIDNLMFSIDGENYTTNPYYENLEAGSYFLTIKNFIDCIYSKQSFYILNYPKFFTPNNDGFNEEWKINFSELDDDIKTHIYNRYGILLKVLLKEESWDGKFQSNDLPSDDYWFYVIRKNGVIHKGHFTLKR